MKVAVCLWGICRSSDKTIQSFNECVIAPLKSWGWHVDLYLHTYSVTTPYVNRRAGEIECQLNNNLYELYPTRKSVIAYQSYADKQIGLEQYRTHPDPWNSNYATADNHIRALYSLREVFQLIENPYNYIVFCRPDVLFLTPLTQAMFALVTDKCVVLPDFCKFPINDRFAICTPAAARVYAERFNTALEYSKEKPLHSETNLNHILKSAGITVVEQRIRFKRIRANGVDGDRGVTA